MAYTEDEGQRRLAADDGGIPGLLQPSYLAPTEGEA